jgi:hypothetical protein
MKHVLLYGSNACFNIAGIVSISLWGATGADQAAPTSSAAFWFYLFAVSSSLLVNLFSVSFYACRWVRSHTEVLPEQCTPAIWTCVGVMFSVVSLCAGSVVAAKAAECNGACDPLLSAVLLGFLSMVYWAASAVANAQEWLDVPIVSIVRPRGTASSDRSRSIEVVSTQDAPT